MDVEVQLPDTPLMVSGGLGGPLVMFIVTPMRNALTLGATNRQASAMQLYRSVFSSGVAGGWTGGMYPAIAASPQFLCLGPAFHFYASFAGVPGGVVLTGLSESALVYGAETRNAQMAKNMKSPGTVTNIHPAYKPWGPGVSFHILRNTVTIVGMRMFCKPCTDLVQRATGKRNELTQITGDFIGNCCGACLSAPSHQIFSFIVTTPELSKLSGAEKRARILRFLKDQYLETDGGRTRLSSTMPRDMFMRSMYAAAVSTMYIALERTLVSLWKTW